MEYAVTTKQLCKVFGGHEVLRSCTMNVERGSVYGLLGRNGAGKTTLFKLLLGLLRPTAGSAAVLGLDITENRREILRRTGSLIETPVFYEHLSATENLRLHLAYMGLPERRAEETLELVGLPHTGGQRVSAFSLGMRQRLAMARAIVHQLDLLILDEPANGLDPAGIRALRDLLIYLSRHKNMTILLSSHILSETEQTCDQVGILAGGMIQGEADPQDIARRCPGGLEEYFLQLTGRWSA